MVVKSKHLNSVPFSHIITDYKIICVCACVCERNFKHLVLITNSETFIFHEAGG